MLCFFIPCRSLLQKCVFKIITVIISFIYNEYIYLLIIRFFLLFWNIIVYAWSLNVGTWTTEQNDNNDNRVFKNSVSVNLDRSWEEGQEGNESMFSSCCPCLHTQGNVNCHSEIRQEIWPGILEVFCLSLDIKQESVREREVFQHVQKVELEYHWSSFLHCVSNPVLFHWLKTCQLS